jgi:hypothetical protein
MIETTTAVVATCVRGKRDYAGSGEELDGLLGEVTHQGSHDSFYACRPSHIGRAARAAASGIGFGGVSSDNGDSV